MSDQDAPAPADAEAEAPAEPTTPPDPAREALADALRRDLGDGFLEHANANGDLWIRVSRDCWRRAAETLKVKHGFDYFCFVSGIDWLENPELSSRYEAVYSGDGGSGEDGGDEAAPAADAGPTLLGDRVAGGDTRFTVFGRVFSTTKKWGVTLKADLDEANPTVESWVTVYRGADWHERETWEMFGFQFDGHPGLRHMYLPGGFEGFPLRKDFPLLARMVKPWPGLVDKEPIPGEDDDSEQQGEQQEAAAT
ncbi:MAG TPA: NADH-quinone oxidoreductase subunit C [Acidimicrobiales bacterium]